MDWEEITRGMLDGMQWLISDPVKHPQTWTMDFRHITKSSSAVGRTRCQLGNTRLSSGV